MSSEVAPSLPAGPPRADSSRPRSRLWTWLDSRTGIGAVVHFLRQQAQKPVPRPLSWLYTAGTLAAFFFALQFVTGFLMLMYYVPEEGMAYRSVQQIQHDVPLGWLVRQMHAWGSHFIVVVLLLHVFKVLWFGAYKRPREFTWFVGFLLLVLTLGFCLSGCLLTWNQLAYWATRVGVATIDSIPYFGPTLKGWVCGSPDVSGSTLGRFFSLHVIVLPAVLVILLGVHLALVLRHGITPKTTTREEKELGYGGALETHGAESFFPRQVFRELFVLNFGFALLVTVATLWPLELGEPQSSHTPENIKPEWYFLPVYQFLKYFDDSLYAALPFLENWAGSYQITPEFLGFCVINLVGLALFLLPLLDRGRERAIRRRPFFAVVAFALVISIAGLGALGYVAGRTATFGGKTYRFTSKGYPELVAAEREVEPRAAAEREPELDGGEGENRVADGASEAAAADESAADALADGDEPGDTADAPGNGADPDESADVPKTGEEPGDTADIPENGDEPGDTAVAGTDVVTFRADKLPPGGTCSNADCHDSAPEDDWLGSVHFDNQVECRQCHGGIDVPMPPLPKERRADLEDLLEPEVFAHLGVHLSRRGKVVRPPGKEINSLCGKCHSEVLQVFSELHYDNPPPGQIKMTCIKCHANHAVKPASEALYAEGYEDTDDPRTAPFKAAKGDFARLEDDIHNLETELEKLKALDYPPEQFIAAIDTVREELNGKRHLVHALDQNRLEAETEGLKEYLAAIEKRLGDHVRELQGRWRFVAFAWGGVIILNALILLKLLSLSGSRRRVKPGVPPGPEAGVPAFSDPEAPASELAGPPESASLPYERFAVDTGADLGPATPQLVDRLRIASLPDVLFEVDEETEHEGTRPGDLTVDDRERRALLDDTEEL